MPGYRKERIEKEIRMIVADALLKDIKDPRIGFVTVTGAKLNKDKSVAVVSVSVMGDDKSKKKSMMGLNSAKGFFQFKVGRGLQMRNTPKIIFELDTSIEDGVNMVNNIMKLEESRIKNESFSDQEEDDDER